MNRVQALFGLGVAAMAVIRLSGASWKRIVGKSKSYAICTGGYEFFPSSMHPPRCSAHPDTAWCVPAAVGWFAARAPMLLMPPYDFGAPTVPGA